VRPEARLSLERCANYFTLRMPDVRSVAGMVALVGLLVHRLHALHRAGHHRVLARHECRRITPVPMAPLGHRIYDRLRGVLFRLRPSRCFEVKTYRRSCGPCCRSTHLLLTHDNGVARRHHPTHDLLPLCLSDRCARVVPFSIRWPLPSQPRYGNPYSVITDVERDASALVGDFLHGATGAGDEMHDVITNLYRLVLQSSAPLRSSGVRHSARYDVLTRCYRFP